MRIPAKAFEPQIHIGADILAAYEEASKLSVSKYSRFLLETYV